MSVKTVQSTNSMRFNNFSALLSPGGSYNLGVSVPTVTTRLPDKLDVGALESLKTVARAEELNKLERKRTKFEFRTTSELVQNSQSHEALASILYKMAAP